MIDEFASFEHVSRLSVWSIAQKSPYLVFSNHIHDFSPLLSLVWYFCGLLFLYDKKSRCIPIYSSTFYIWLVLFFVEFHFTLEVFKVLRLLGYRQSFTLCIVYTRLYLVGNRLLLVVRAFIRRFSAVNDIFEYRRGVAHMFDNLAILNILIIRKSNTNQGF